MNCAHGLSEYSTNLLLARLQYACRVSLSMISRLNDMFWMVGRLGAGVAVEEGPRAPLPPLFTVHYQHPYPCLPSPLRYRVPARPKVRRKAKRDEHRR